MLTIFIRIILIYSLLIGTMRITGKRQIGQLQLSELITTILLSELAAGPISDDQIPIALAVIPIVTLLSLEVIISFAVTKIPFLKTIFDGKPSILIRKGSLCLDEISRVRINMEELIGQLRISGVSDISDVYYAILEQNGQLSVITKKSSQPPSCESLNINAVETGISHTLIVDSHIDKSELDVIGKNEQWLNSRLEKHNLSIDQVFLYSIDDSGKEFFFKK